MAERFLIKREIIGAAEVTSGTGPSPTPGDVFRELNIDGEYGIISVYVVPEDTADAADDSTIDISYRINNTFRKLKGATAGVAVRNEIFPFTTEDAFENLKIDISSGATDPVEGYVIEVWGYRP